MAVVAATATTAALVVVEEAEGFLDTPAIVRISMLYQEVLERSSTLENELAEERARSRDLSIENSSCSSLRQLMGRSRKRQAVERW